MQRARAVAKELLLRPPPAAQTRYARLPKDSDGDKESSAEKKPSTTSRTEDAITAVLNDPTLRSGDIVMFVDGLRVFNGRSEAPHRMTSFEDPSRSKLVSAASRTVLATLAPNTAAPIREPRRPGRPVLVGTQERQTSALQRTSSDTRRVVYP